MLNFRKIDKFYLSGGWDNLPENITFLRQKRIKAVLDLQFIDPAANATIAYIKRALEKIGIEYHSIFMEDSEMFYLLDETLLAGHQYLLDMEEKYTEKRDGILVKCAAGISRSPTMLINYYCVSRRMSYVEALNYIRAKENNQGIEFGASPNMIFAEHLKKRFK